MALEIIGGKTVTPYRVIEEGYIRVEEGEITAVGPLSTAGGEGRGLEAVEGGATERVDVHGKVVMPGFIDLHVHGGGGADTMDATYDALNTMSLVHAAGGTTAMVPATVSAPMERVMRSVEAVEEAMRRGVRGARVLGIHLEGPYISRAQRGAQEEEYIREPTREEVQELVAHAATIKAITAAPEVPGVFGLAREMSSRGVLMSIGHSDATVYDVEKALEAGFTHVTHLYSGCSTVKRVNAFRYPGVIEAAYLFDGLSVDIIADGKHLPPYLIKLILKNKGVGSVNVITDAMRAAGMPPGKYKLGDQEVIVDQGVAWLPDRSAFAGSVSTMGEMAKVLIRDVGLSLTEVAAMTSTNPAKLLGLKGKGALAVGKDADVVILNDDFSVYATIVEGKFAYGPRK